jgi:hypothetical protein
MTAFAVLPLLAARGERAAALPACRWFAELRVLAVAGGAALTTGEHETCALLLAGTFDLQGGATAWPARGARRAPTAGRPVAVFLPPRTPFRAANGDGEILLLGARQPPAPPATGRQALQQSPLLPLAGSLKAFDPLAGDWKPAETFPTAPESLPPRRIARVEIAGCAVERVFAADYKAATLTVDEVVLPADATLRLADLPLPAATECLLYARTDGELQLAAGAARAAVRGEQAVFWPGPPAPLQLAARGAPAYVALAYAGK